MTKRDDTVYLKDILESIQQIFTYVVHKTEFDFSSDLLLQDAVIRRFEIIGEAASKISSDFKNNNPGIYSVSIFFSPLKHKKHQIPLNFWCILVFLSFCGIVF